MWVFTSRGFFSIVADRNEPRNLLVRARVKGDIESYWPEADVTKTPDADYLFRASIPRKKVATVIAEELETIAYDAFKPSVEDKRRGEYYLAVWNIMFGLQADMEMES